LRNTGRSPSFYTDFNAKMIALQIPKSDPGELIFGGDPRRFERYAPGIGQFCVTRDRRDVAGQVLFPGDVDVPASADAYMEKDKLDAARAAAAPEKEIYVIVIACIRYESGGRNPHRTVKVFHLLKANCIFCGAFRSDEKKVLRRNLDLVPFSSRDRIWDIAE
jgi:hypothetical protein